MKYLLADAGYTFDTDSKVIKRQTRERAGVNEVYMVDGDCVVTFDDQTIQAQAGDIIVTFYEHEFPNRVIVVKSNEWKQNLETYNENRQKEKERWAKEGKNLEPFSEVSTCDCCKCAA